VFLTNRLIILKQSLIQGDALASALIASLESQLQALILQDLEGRKIRSKTQWIEEGKRLTGYFFKLECERYEKNQVTSVYDHNGTEVFSRQESECDHVSFYTNLFTDEAIDPQCKEQCLENFSSSLLDIDRHLCEEQNSLTDLTNSVKSLNVRKSPGSDGFSVEFFVHFWNLLGPLLLHVAQASFADENSVNQ